VAVHRQRATAARRILRTVARTSERERLERLTARWRARHDAARRDPASRPAADPEREALAARAFPYRTIAPAAYVARHGAEMDGFTYDDAAYADPELDAWLLEVGRLLRAGRRSRAP
jgi:hypothetical protein